MNIDLAITQNHYINEILKNFKMNKVNLVSTLMMIDICLQFSSNEDSELDDGSYCY